MATRHSSWTADNEEPGPVPAQAAAECLNLFLTQRALPAGTPPSILRAPLMVPALRSLAINSPVFSQALCVPPCPCLRWRLVPCGRFCPPA